MLNNKLTKKNASAKDSKTKVIKKSPKKAAKKVTVSKKASVTKKVSASPSKSPAKKSVHKEETKHQPENMWDYFELDTKYKKL